jgi:hypothetical protein
MAIRARKAYPVDQYLRFLEGEIKSEQLAADTIDFAKREIECEAAPLSANPSEGKPKPS